MNSVCIECKECDYYLPVENNIRPIGMCVGDEHQCNYFTVEGVIINDFKVCCCYNSECPQSVQGKCLANNEECTRRKSSFKITDLI